KQVIYLEKAKALILDWITHSTDEKQWRTIDTGIRLVYWKVALDYLLQSELLTLDELTKIKESVQRQLVYLDTDYIEKYDLSNWGILITTGYFVIQMLWPECASAESNQKMRARLEKQLYLQVQPLGNHWE